MKGKKKRETKVQDKVAKFYEDVRYSNKHTLKYEKYWLGRLISKYNKQELVLDNGCGVGVLGNFLDEKHIVGCDISYEMLLNAKTRIKKIVNSDSENLPFKENSFDFIICKGLLHHLDNEGRALGEIGRVLKTGGTVVISEPIKNPVNTLFRSFVSKSSHFSEQHHHYEKTKLISMVKRYFKIKKIDFHGYLSYPLLGFPDIVDVFKYFPFKGPVGSALIFFDKVVSCTPLLRKFSWHLIIEAVKG